jgi:hypothetical protein
MQADGVYQFALSKDGAPDCLSFTLRKEGEEFKLMGVVHYRNLQLSSKEPDRFVTISGDQLLDLTIAGSSFALLLDREVGK